MRTALSERTREDWPPSPSDCRGRALSAPLASGTASAWPCGALAEGAVRALWHVPIGALASGGRLNLSMGAVMPDFILPKGKRSRALDLARSVLAGLDEEHAWKVTAEPVKSARSASQNAYLWAVPNKMISELTGYEAEEVHEYLLGRYFGWKDKRVPKTPRNPSGVESVPVRTTTTDEHGKRSVLSPQQFSDYVDFIQRFAAQTLGIVIPDPDPQFRQHQEAA